jgi:hypothetical protein
VVKVYIASQYSIGDKIENVTRQIECFHKLVELGYNPYVPLLSHYLEVYKHQEYETWMKLDFEWLDCCDCVLRLPGESKGADMEVERATENKIPVFSSIQELHFYMNKD